MGSSTPAPPSAPPVIVADAAMAAASAELELPEGPAAGLEAIDAKAVRIVVTTSEITFDGTPIAKISGGAFSDHRALWEAYDRRKPRSRPEVLIVADRRTPMSTIDDVMTALRPAPTTKTLRIAVVASDSKQMMALPLEHEPKEFDGPRVRPKHYRPIVDISGDKTGSMSLASTTDDEKPSPATQDAAALVDAIEATARRRWPSGKRGRDDDKLLLRAAPNTPLGSVAALAAEIRAKKLFTKLQLWWPGIYTPEDTLERDEYRFADALVAEPQDQPSGSGAHRPGADLAKQINDVRAAGSGSGR
jgi:hypothetical protein